jgi:hypothetical protein
MDLIWARREAKYFCAKDWTGSISLIGFDKSAVWRKGREGAIRRDRHYEPTGRANARPMTGSAKQSMLQRKESVD